MGISEEWPPGWRARRWRGVAGWACAGLALYAVYLQISLGGRVDSDGANSALQAWDLIHGDLLLHGWLIGDATYYSFELPINGITQLIFGLGPLAAHVASALVYFIVTACAVALAVAGSRGGPARVARSAVTVTVLAAPLLTMLTVSTLIEEPDHPGTSVFILIPALLVDRLPGSPLQRPARWWVAPVVCLILAAGELGDATVTYVAVPAIALACAYRVLAGRRWRSADAAVLLAAIVSVPLEMLVRALMTRLGGYHMVAPRTQLAPPIQWPGHVGVVWLVLRYLYGAVAGPGTMLGAAGAALGLICLLAAIAGLGKVAWTWRRVTRAEQVIAVAIVVNLGIYLVSRMPMADGAREIAAVLPCGAVLAARALVPSQLDRRARALTAVALSGLIALFPLAVAASRPHIGPATGPAPGDPGNEQTAPLTAWLEGHGITYGVSGYWDSSIVTLQSGGRVAIRTIDLGPKPDGHGLHAYVRPWETNALWYDPARHDARWAIADVGHGKYTVHTYETLFGQPEAMYRIDSWVALEYRANLLSEIQPVAS
ncbi:MAG TPA: hypothetical protein VI365_07240 [Trebonia sp.]